MDFVLDSDVISVLDSAANRVESFTMNCAKNSSLDSTSDFVLN